MQRAVLITLMAVTLGGCSTNRARVVSSPYSSGASHTEPVFYNGKNYSMQFQYQAFRNAYDVNITGKGGRRLGRKAGDQKIARQVASSAIGYFACARGQKAFVVPGTLRNTNGTWQMQARCA